MCRAFGAHNDEARVAKRSGVFGGEPVGCGGGKCAIAQLERGLDMVKGEARIDVFFEGAKCVNARVFSSCEPANLIHAVTC